uniref:Large ribosomal subunit protein uL23c n=1 Tax=Monomorphina parapyrum TaxID=1664066 RepID=A0A0G3VH48_9EUGL|nr:ribosomal protein L23 [Monomorphina parapyrum]AKL78954.1 ribosomal protein L23 [Monomorphina parapyrum]
MIDLIKSQVLSEKATKLLEYNKYTFDVDVKFDKKQLKSIIQEVFDVEVVFINTYILPGKKRRLGKFEGFKNSYKRVFVTLKSDKTIPYFTAL